MWKNALSLRVLVFGVCYGFSFAWIECPNAQDILPCYCNPSYNLICNNIEDVEELRRFAINMEGIRYEYPQLYLQNSSLQYLPKELLENVNVREMLLVNVSLIKVFENPPVSLEPFASMRFVSVRLMRGVIWTVFRNMDHLKTLSINDISVSTLGNDFKENVPHSLRQLELFQTKTKKFEMGVFNDFKNLEKIEINRCRLEELHRGHFPVPFNVLAMYFGDNRIKTIPADLFTEMPMLRDVTLYGNQIASVPESAFGGRFDQLQTFLIQGNPLKCDCSLKWIVYSKPVWFDGTCASPKIMHGRELKNLTSYDFPC